MSHFNVESTTLHTPHHVAPIWSKKLTRRRFGLLAAATAGVLAPLTTSSPGARTFAATPATDDLTGYPELRLVSTDTELILPPQIAAGRYLVTIENQATLGESAPNFIVLPEGQTTETLLSGTTDPTSGMPAWFYDTTIVGGPIAPIGATAQAIIDFAVGRYAISAEPFQPTYTLDVVPGSASASPEPRVDATITIGNGILTGVPTRISTGRQLWRVTAAGDVPHRFQLYGYPDVITLEQLLAAYTHLIEGTTPESDLPDLSLLMQLGGLGAQSGGLTGWPVIDLPAGQYFAVCGMQEGEEALPHALMGEATAFTVTDQ